MADHPPCPVCGDAMAAFKAPDKCPACGAPPRVRALPGLMSTVIAPWIARNNADGRPLLAFAASRLEKQLLRGSFEAIQSASLYGNYKGDHDLGVDVRAMPNYADASFGAAMSLLLFDYFPEHEQALAELWRVLAPGGIFFTHIAAGRVRKDASPPTATRRIEARPGYFEYIPEDHQMLNVTVGEDWLLAAIARVGFDAHQTRSWDQASRQAIDWFIGYKAPDGDARSVASSAPPTMSPAPNPVRAALSEASNHDDPRSPRGRRTLIPAALNDGVQLTEGESRSFLREVDPAFGFTRVRLTLTVPPVPWSGRMVMFGEHRAGSREVIGLLTGAVIISEDLGQSWRLIDLPDAAGVQLERCFTTTSGHHLLQSLTRDAEHPEGRVPARIFRYTSDWRFAGVAQAGDFNWHGRASIGQNGDTIMWAEYPNNKAKYTPGREHEGVSPRVWRSRDDGRSWELAFEQPPEAIRHFHTCVADPCVPGQWWVSSGDKTRECRVWVSSDDGDSWRDITNVAPDVPLHPAAVRHAQAVQRYTDIVIGESALIWGADDWLGGHKRIFDPKVGEAHRAGARLFRSPRVEPIQPSTIGWIGNPVRSIVDVGPAYIVTTEAKNPELPEPQVYLLAKNGSDALVELCTVELFNETGTGLTYSRASAAAVDGHFFSYRNSRDLMVSQTRLLHWRIEFE